MTTSSPVTSRTDTVGVEACGAELPPPHPFARAVARGVDMFTVLFVTLAVVLLGLAPVMDAVSDRLAPEPWGRALAATILYAAVGFVYEVSFLVARGQTPGKDLLNLRVVDAVTGAPPGWSGAIRRTLPFALLRIVPGVLLGTVVVVVLGASVPFGSRCRGVHDVLAGTVVVRYDADAEEEDRPEIDRAALSKRYGPRSIWEMFAGRGRPE